MARTMLLGEGASVDKLRSAMRENPGAGLHPVVTLAGPASSDDTEIEQWLDDVVARGRETDASAVAVSASDQLDSDVVRRLAWRLEGPGIDLLVAPALGDIAGPRVSLRPAAGLPLIHLDEPHLTGPKRVLKRGFDLLVGGAALIVSAPVLLLAMLAVRATGSPVFYRSDRIGQSGHP